MVKNVVSYIIVLLLIIMIVASSALIVFSTTILNKNYVLDMLKKEDYYSITYSIIMEKFKDNTIQSGLEETILDGIITKEQVENDINSFIAYLYTGIPYQISTATVKTNLEESINRVIEENNKKVDSSEKKAIEIYVKTITDIYEDGIIFSNDYISQIQKSFEKIQNAVNKVKVIIYIGTIALIIFIVLLNRKNALKLLSVTAISAGILLIVPKILETIALEMQNVVILNQILSKTVIDTVEDVLLKLVIFGVLLIVFGIIGSIFSGKIITNNKNNY